MSHEDATLAWDQPPAMMTGKDESVCRQSVDWPGKRKKKSEEKSEGVTHEIEMFRYEFMAFY